MKSFMQKARKYGQAAQTLFTEQFMTLKYEFIEHGLTLINEHSSKPYCSIPGIKANVSYSVEQLVNQILKIDKHTLHLIFGLDLSKYNDKQAAVRNFFFGTSLVRRVPIFMMIITISVPGSMAAMPL